MRTWADPKIIIAIVIGLVLGGIDGWFKGFFGITGPIASVMLLWSALGSQQWCSRASVNANVEQLCGAALG